MLALDEITTTKGPFAVLDFNTHPNEFKGPRGNRRAFSILDRQERVRDVRRPRYEGQRRLLTQLQVLHRMRIERKRDCLVVWCLHRCKL